MKTTNKFSAHAAGEAECCPPELLPMFDPFTLPSDEVLNAASSSPDFDEANLYQGMLDAALAPPFYPAKQTPMLPAEVVWATGDAVHIGIDCEYEYCPETKGNLILSYQYHLVANGQYLAEVLYPKSHAVKDRLQFERFIGHALHEAKKQRLITEWPEHVVIYGHFLRADLTHFGSFWSDLKVKVGSVRKTLASLTGTYGVDVDEIGSRKAGNEPMVLRDQYRKAFRCKVRFIDTLPLTPNGAGLSVVGDLLGQPKLELPDGYDKGSMLRLLEEDKPAFEAYALRDAKIAVEYGLRMQQFACDLGLKKLPNTIGAMAVAVFKGTLNERELDTKAIFGQIVESVEYWNKASGRAQTTKHIVPSPARALFEEQAVRSYHGGRNECFTNGPSAVGVFNDFDLTGAYTTGLCDLKPLDYGAARMTINADDFRGHRYGLARVKFRFPKGTRYPCLPVRHYRYGLIFPMAGDSYCTAPEIEVALNMGCLIDIQQGVVVPWVQDGPPLFEPFVQLVRQKRSQYAKKSFEGEMWKEIGNSLYGKTAQGVRGKTAFDTANGLNKAIPPSAITNPYFAAHTTGFIRAVIGELLAAIPANRTVISVTTDGFLTDATEAELDISGPVCGRFNLLNNTILQGI